MLAVYVLDGQIDSCRPISKSIQNTDKHILVASSTKPLITKQAIPLLKICLQQFFQILLNSEINKAVSDLFFRKLTDQLFDLCLQ